MNEDLIRTIINGINTESREILTQLSKLDEKQQSQLLAIISKLAEQGDQDAAKALQKLQNPKKAALGAKLNYIQRLKGCCPEGEELVYFKIGGKMKCACQKKGGNIKKKKKLC